MQTSERLRPLNQNPEAVRRLRVLKGLEQDELAERAGIRQSTLSTIETGKRSAGVKVIHRLAAALGCKVVDLLAPVEITQQTEGSEGDE